jgi:anti-sigma B factor antagonist
LLKFARATTMHATAMNITESDRDGVLVLRVTTSRIDAGCAQDFRTALGAVVARGITRFVIDLGGVDFVDSTGLGALVSALKASGQKGAVVVAGARDSVATLFKLTRMDKVFRMYPSESEAAAALAKDAA